MKACSKCHVVKALDLFPRNNEMADGHLNECKACKKAYLAAYRQKNADTLRAYDRERASQPDRVAHRAKTVREYQRQFPERVKAVAAVNNAIRDKRLVPWPVCAVPECNRKPVAHHPDYDQPLSVVWLCQSHHKRTHELTKEAPTPGRFSERRHSLHRG